MEKLAKLRKNFAKAGIDGLLITSPYNRRYMANFTGTAGVVLISADRAQFITDFRYVEQASKQCAPQGNSPALFDLRMQTHCQSVPETRQIPRACKETP